MLIRAAPIPARTEHLAPMLAPCTPVLVPAAGQEIVAMKVSYTLCITLCTVMSGHIGGGFSDSHWNSSLIVMMWFPVYIELSGICTSNVLNFFDFHSNFGQFAPQCSR